MDSLDFFKQFVPARTTQTINNNDVIAYTRVSSKAQYDTNDSVSRQEKDARNYANLKGYNIVATFGGTYESAKSDFTRKEFEKMITYIKKLKKKPFGILIYKVSRFSRSGAGAIGIVHELVTKMGVHLIEVCSGVDTTTEAGRGSIYESLLQARKENQDRTDIVVDGMKGYVKKGNRLGNCPMGYDHYGKRVKNPLFFHPFQKIVLNDLGKKLREAWKWKSELGMSDADIRVKLERDYGVTITLQKLSAMWRNPFYCGINTNKLLDGVPVRGHWEAMISIEVFKKVQQIINENRHGYKHNFLNPQRPLIETLLCKECGKKLTGYEVKRVKCHFYKCQKCRGVSINAETTKRARGVGAHQMFADLLATFKIDTRIIGPFSMQFRKMFSYKLKDQAETEKRVGIKIEEKQQELQMLIRNYNTGKFSGTEQMFHDIKQQIQKEITDLQAGIQNLLTEISNLDTLLDRAVRLLENLKDFWVNADLFRRRAIQKILFPRGLMLDMKVRAYLTTDINKFIILMSSASMNSADTKKESPTVFGGGLCLVAGTRFELVTFGL